MKRLFCLFVLFGQLTFAGEFTIGVEQLNYLPYYDGSTTNYSGYARDLLDGFAASKGHKFKYISLPVERLYQELINGKIDMKFPDNPNWKKEFKEGRGFIYSSVVAKTTDGLFMLNSRHNETEIKVLGTIGGFEPWPYIDQVKAGKITLSNNTDLGALLKMVSLKRIDAAYFNTVVAKKKLNELGLAGEVSYNAKMPHDDGTYSLSSIKQGNIISEFNDYLAKNSVLVNDLKKKYGIE